MELQDLKILDKVSVISSISGSSLTAGYYGLHGHDPDEWNEEKLRQIFLQDFQSSWELRWFLPWHIARYWITDFDRSDIMKEVFDSFLFDEKTFGDMGDGDQLPRILINATSLTREKRFTFTDAAFLKLGSGLNTYQISHAVMASGAFPGAFHNVTLRDHTKAHRFEHLFDGGPVDNLGVDTLERVLHDLAKERGNEAPPLRCMLIIVDAHPDPWRRGEDKRDTREPFDFFVDTNAIVATDVLLNVNRERLLEKLHLNPITDKGKKESYSTYEPFSDERYRDEKLRKISCGVWHLSFRRLAQLGDTHPEAQGFRAIVNNIPTAYRLAFWSSEAEVRQDALFRAAEILICEDSESRREVFVSLKKWFREDFGPGPTPCGKGNIGSMP
jgi:predicted acylesterase/phospholipase RssA